MNPDPSQTPLNRNPLLVARLLVVALCFFSVGMHALVYVMAVLEGDLARLRFDLEAVPFSEPPVMVLGLLALTTFAGVLVLNHLFFHRGPARTPANPMAPVTRILLLSALLETISIYGLVLGFMFHEAVTALSTLLFAITMAGGALIFPRAEHWPDPQDLPPGPR